MTEIMAKINPRDLREYHMACQHVVDTIGGILKSEPRGVVVLLVNKTEAGKVQRFTIDTSNPGHRTFAENAKGTLENLMGDPTSGLRLKHFADWLLELG